MLTRHDPGCRCGHLGVFMVVLACLLIVSCAASSPFERVRPIMGTWLTDQGITVAIRRSPDEGFGAYIVEAPGFRGGAIKVGSAVITGIKPRPDGSFTGMFVMPGGEDPVPVQMALSSQGNLVVVARDRRFEGSVMTWRRVNRR